MNSHSEFSTSWISLRSSTFLLLLIGVLLIFCSCGSAGDDSNVLKPKEPIPVEKVDEIVPDTSLYHMNVKEWNEASEEKRKANCAGIIETSMDSFEVQDSEKFNELSEELCACIRELTYGMPTMNDNAVMNEAKRCLATMGYREESDSLSLN